MTKKDLALERIHRNGLISPFPSTELCVRSLGGIQSQVQQFAELAILNRCSGAPTTKELDKAYHGHRFINLWGQRKTLHMYTAEDWDIICDVYHDKTYIQNEVSKHSDYFTEIIAQVQSMTSSGKLIERTHMDELVKACAPESLLENSFLTYMVQGYLCANGVLFGIPAKPSIRRFACFSALDRSQWEWNEERRATSLEEMMLRYFQHYGPATIQDFSHWSGLSIMVFREVFERIQPKLTAVTIDKRTYYTFGSVEIKLTRKLSLLGKFDPLFVSYRHKDWIATPGQQKQIWRNAGHVEAVILDGAKLLGTWRHTLKSDKMFICVEPLASISQGAKERIEAKAKRLARFWDKELESITYK